MFDPEGNVFVPGYKEVKRKIRRDGKFIRPTDGFTVRVCPHAADYSSPPGPPRGELCGPVNSSQASGLKPERCQRLSAECHCSARRSPARLWAAACAAQALYF